MKRKKILSLCLAGCVALAVPAAVYAESEESQKKVEEKQADSAVETETPVETATSAETEAPAEAEITAKPEVNAETAGLYRFSAKIGEHRYQFPIPYTEFIEKGGWEVVDYYKDQEEDMLSPNSYTYMGLEKDGNEITAYVINYDINEAAMKDCYVGGIEIDTSYNFDIEAMPVILPGKMRVGESSLRRLKKIYGQPSDMYEAEEYTKLTYEKDSKAYVELFVNKETSVLERVQLRNFTTPENFVFGEVSRETPEMVANYKAPKALTDDFTDPIVEYFGDLYQLPAPVRAFTANGWVLGDSTSEDEPVEYIPGNGVVAADMTKENQTVRVYLYNDTPNAILYENAMIHELGFYTYDSESIAMKLSGGVVLGADADELMALAKENGYYVNDEMEDGYLTVAKSEKEKYDKYVEFWIDTEEDAVAVAGISVHCEQSAE